jgi:predicted acetyltransferase
LGYAIANSTNEINIPVASLSQYLMLKNSAHLICDRIAATEVKDILSNFLYENLRSQSLFPHSHGLVITNFNYEQWWHLHRQKMAVVIKRDRQPVAMAIYTIDSSGNLPIGDRQIEISSIFWTDLESRDRLLHFFASHRDQVHSIKMPTPTNTNVHTWLRDAGRLNSAITDPWMVRAVDVVGALHGLAVTCESFTFALSDPYCHWNDGVFGISGERGQLTVKRHGSDIANLEIDFHVTIAGISALIYGTHAIAELVHKQWLTQINAATCERLEKCFIPCVIYNPFKF